MVPMPLSYPTFHGSSSNTPYTPRTLFLSGWYHPPAGFSPSQQVDSLHSRPIPTALLGWLPTPVPPKATLRQTMISDPMPWHSTCSSILTGPEGD